MSIRIRMERDAAGPIAPFRAGLQYVVSEAIGRPLIDDGFVIRVDVIEPPVTERSVLAPKPKAQPSATRKPVKRAPRGR